jgi:hypothetical protein
MRARSAAEPMFGRGHLLLAAITTACAALAPGAVEAQSPAGARRLEAHVWPNDGEPAPLTAGAADDLWTISGSHHRFDGTKLGQLEFSDRFAGKPDRIYGIRVARAGQVFVVGIWSALGWSLSAHDQNGQQRWIKALGRVSAKSSAQGPVKRRGQEEPSPEITWAEILGVDDTGSVRISGWLKGCVDLAPRPASFVECATLERAGKNFASDADAFPQLFFTSTFDDSGGWKGSRAFPRLEVRDISWSSADDSLAATASGWWTKPLVFQAPAGTPSSISFGEGDPPYKSIVALFDRTGRLRGALHLLAREAQVVRSLTFDEHGGLWMLTTYSPGLEVRGPGRVRTGASVGNCLSLLSLADVKSGKMEQATYFHASYCTPSRSASFPSTLSAGPDDRVIVSWAPAGMFEGEPFEPPPGLASPPPPRDIYGNVSRDYVPTRLVVTRRGRLEWSSPIPASHAIGLPGGWVCFEVPTKLACVRPTNATSTPSAATADPGKLPGAVDRRPRQDH